MSLPSSPRRRVLRGRIRLPRRTVRLKLTLLYGGLVVGTGVALVAFTYPLVSSHPAACALSRQAGSLAAFCTRSVVGGAPLTVRRSVSGTSSVSGTGAGGGPVGLPPLTKRVSPLAQQARLLPLLVQRQDGAELNQVAVTSGIALAILAVLSIGIGWLVSGRVLRPLRTITTAVQDISATSLHRRLGMTGPGDELKDLGDTFDALLGRLERSFQAQQQFVTNASHELRTPLARQRTLAEVALADPHATTRSLRAAHRRVLAAGLEQERLIEALLTLARGQRGLDQLQSVDLAAVAADVIAVQQPEAARRRVDLVAQCDPARADGNPRLLERMVANLVDNAVRHNAAGGRVDLVTGTDCGRSELRISNTGAVVPPAQVAHLGEPFHRLGQVRPVGGEGHGLGLSIVDAIATAHGAALAIRARDEGGLEVRVRFPPTRLDLAGGSATGAGAAGPDPTGVSDADPTSRRVGPGG